MLLISLAWASLVIVFPMCAHSIAGALSVERKQETTSTVPKSLIPAEPCDDNACKLPKCRCSKPTLGSNFTDKEDRIPQLVTVTFDDAVTAINFNQIQELFDGIVNPDGCDARATFYICHEYTDYTKVNALYSQGHEIALHTVTHGQGTEYWREANEDLLMRELGQQIEMLQTFAKVSRRHIRGMRMPFLQISGNITYAVAKNLNLLYDSSWPTQTFVESGLWPYTLDYRSIQDCQIGVCPSASFPGLWIVPMISWRDTEGYSCAMMDACIYMPKDDVDEIFNWMMGNFKRSYDGNRSPFGAYLHAAWFQRGKHYFEAFKKFLNHINGYPDVYITTVSRAIDYMKNPVLGKPFKACPRKPKSSCRATRCQLTKLETGEERWLDACDKCPEVYPWLDNPRGLRQNSLGIS